MGKKDNPPILSPGIHGMTLQEFRRAMVDPFPLDSQRLVLFAQLEQWVAKLRSLKVSAILWLNGSFVTEKFAPGDIDCVMWNPDFVADVTEDEKRQVSELVDRSTARMSYGLDLYLLAPSSEEMLHRQAYWRGLFGFQHDGISAKGFVELEL